MYKQILIKPRISEKSYDLSKSSNVYVFSVPKSANKLMVSKAVSEQFNVSVEKVHVAYLPSKPKRSIRQGGRKVNRGRQAGIKKAYVRIKKGDLIPIFAAEDEEKARTEKINKQLEKGKK